MKSVTFMSSNSAARQNFATRFATVLRRFEAEGGDIQELAEAVFEEPRDLRRWAAEGGKIPGHVVNALLGELPLHLSNYWIAPTGLILSPRNTDGEANPLSAAAQASRFSANVIERQADGFCHRDREATRDDAQRLIATLQPIAGE